jgi:hypothetical protein
MEFWLRYVPILPKEILIHDIFVAGHLFSIAVAIENKSLGLGILGEEVHPPTHS